MTVAVLVMCGLIAGIVLSIDAGHRIGVYRRSRHPERVPSVHPSIEASVFGLMGLLVAFTFYGAGSRFDRRRDLIVQESNAIGTAYRRIDLLPPEIQPRLRDDFRKYLRSRLAIYEAVPDLKAVRLALNRSAALQSDIWRTTLEALKESGPAEKSLMVTSLNEMIDITTDRTVALMTHPPVEVFIMLALSVVASSALAGYNMSASEVRNWVSSITLAVVVGLALYVVFDYEYPRVGLIRIDPVDRILAETLMEMY